MSPVWQSQQACLISSPDSQNPFSPQHFFFLLLFTSCFFPSLWTYFHSLLCRWKYLPLSSLHTQILSRAHFSSPLTLCTWPALAPRSSLTSQPSGQAGSPHTPCGHPELPASAHMLLEASVPFHMHSLPPELATSSAETKAKGKAPSISR